MKLRMAQSLDVPVSTRIGPALGEGSDLWAIRNTITAGCFGSSVTLSKCENRASGTRSQRSLVQRLQDIWPGIRSPVKI